MTYRISWQKALSDRRVPKAGDTTPSAVTQDDFRTPFEADYDRVVFSDPFRRLAKKTQVHPLAPNDHVHNRLTHSIESASLGRSFGRLVATLPEVRQTAPGLADHIPTILQVACLIHDIGNPPFGHAGEEVIREWATHEAPRIFGETQIERLRLSDQTKRDLKSFEGNAQGFRIASLANNAKYGYMRLTYASLGSMVKYPWHSLDSRAEAKGKHNYFYSEKDIFHTVWDTLGLVNTANVYVRHPLSFLVEAADDICYRILDMEDAVLMKICDEKQVRDLFYQILPEQEDSKSLSELRGKAIRILIHEAWRVFVGDYEAIMTGSRLSSLTKDFDQRYQTWIKAVDDLYNNEIFAHRSKIAQELGAYRVLGRILNALTKATRDLCEAQDFKRIGFVQRRCVELAWGESYAVANQQQSFEWWIRQTMDYVSGLTDNYALQISAEIEGAL
jgi:dGTPase